MSHEHAKPEWAQSRREKKNIQRASEGLKPKRRLWPWLVLVLIIAAVILFFVFRPTPPAPQEVEAEAVVMQLRQSETTQVEPQMLRETVKVTGTLVPGRQADVASQASGRVIAVMVQPGDAVTDGDVLAQIDRATLELQLKQQRATAEATRAQLQSSQQQLDRTEQLASQGLTSPSNLEQARSAAAALQANLDALESAAESAELALNNATVKAPLDGVVSSRSVDPGQTISAGTALFTVVNLDEMEFQAAASVNNSARVNTGQPVVISVTGLEGQTFEGSVTRVNPVASSGTRTVPIYIALDNPKGALRGGMFATGQIVVAEKTDALAVPAAAMREDVDGAFVLKLADGVLMRAGVEVVQQWNRGDLVEVSGLEAGDLVVSAPLAELSAGDAYTLVEG